MKNKIEKNKRKGILLFDRTMRPRPACPSEYLIKAFAVREYIRQCIQRFKVHNPAITQRPNNVVTTSLQRRDVAATL